MIKNGNENSLFILKKSASIHREFANIQHNTEILTHNSLVSRDLKSTTIAAKTVGTIMIVPRLFSSNIQNISLQSQSPTWIFSMNRIVKFFLLNIVKQM